MPDVQISVHKLRRLRRAADSAFVDELTQLPNFRALRREIGRATRNLRRFTKPFALVGCDLIGFGALNRRFGHDETNEIIRKTAKQLARRVKTDRDFCARFGGDEFFFVLDVNTHAVLRSVLDRLRRVCHVEHGAFDLLISTYAVGAIARSATDAATIERRVHQLLRAAKRRRHSSATVVRRRTTTTRQFGQS